MGDNDRDGSAGATRQNSRYDRLREKMLKDLASQVDADEATAETRPAKRNKGAPRKLDLTLEKILSSSYYQNRVYCARHIRDLRMAQVRAALADVKREHEKLGGEPIKEEDRAKLDDQIDEIFAAAQGLEVTHTKQGLRIDEKAFNSLCKKDS